MLRFLCYNFIHDFLHLLNDCLRCSHNGHKYCSLYPLFIEFENIMPWILYHHETAIKIINDVAESQLDADLVKIFNTIPKEKLLACAPETIFA